MWPGSRLKVKVEFEVSLWAVLLLFSLLPGFLLTPPPSASGAALSADYAASYGTSLVCS